MAATDDTPRTRITWDYAPAPESADHVRLRDAYGLFIGGEFVDPRDGRRVPSINPATEEPVAEVAFAGEADVAAAVEAARAAQPKWAKLPGRERAKYLFRVARLIQERARELAVVESMDGGKPIRESRDVDIPLAAAHFFYYAGWADKLEYGVGGRKAKPYGVVGQIVPWNFPLLMAAWKLAPALACGNTAILKPAETTPLTALLLAEIFQEAEVPAGVANIVPGDGVAGAALVRSRGRQGRLHGLDRGRQGHPGRARRPRRRPHARARRQVGQHRLRGRRHRPGGRGHRAGDLLQPGPRLLRRLAAAHPGVGGRRGHREAVGPHAPAARRRPARQEHRRRRHQLGRAARAHRGAGGGRRGGGRGASHASPATCPSAAGGSRRRSSPTSRPRTASPSRRSSARSCRC